MKISVILAGLFALGVFLTNPVHALAVCDRTNEGSACTVTNSSGSQEPGTCTKQIKWEGRTQKNTYECIANSTPDTTTTGCDPNSANKPCKKDGKDGICVSESYTNPGGRQATRWVCQVSDADADTDTGGDSDTGSDSTSTATEKYTFTSPISATSLEELVATIIKGALAILGSIAVAMVVIAGFQYLTSAGNAQKATQAITTIRNTAIGLAIIVASYLIVDFVINLVSA